MVTDEQVKRLREALARGECLGVAAARAGMSQRTGRRWRRGPLPSESKQPRVWRTRADPFEGVWAWVETQLEEAPELEALTLMEELLELYPAKFHEGQLRTLQRRVRRWRAEKGPRKEVMFRQVHEPGKQGQSDFTCMNPLGVTIAGIAFPHLLYHFQLPYSNWEYAEVAFSETFEALAQGLQNALWKLGGVPEEHRTDNLSAATHQLAGGGREFNQRYRDLLRHLEMEPSRNTPGRGHENGDVEQSHHRLKRALGQALMRRGSRDFETRAAYEAFVAQVTEKLNRRRGPRCEVEHAALRSLPAARTDSWKEVTARVGPGSTIRVDKRTYSVSSQLIGREVRVRVHADELEVRLGQTVVARMERLRGQKRFRIDYRHVIHSLVRKPGAFARYRYRDEMFPRLTFRLAYDALVKRFGGRADREYLHVLHLAATTLECDVAAALTLCLEQELVPEVATVRGLLANRGTPVPEVFVRKPDLARYDELLGRRSA